MVRYKEENLVTKKIEPGDMIYGTNRKLYLVAYDEDYPMFPVRIIDMNTGKVVNGFKTISSFNEGNYIFSGAEIVRVHKNEDVTIIGE